MRDEDLPVFWFRRDGRNYVVRRAAIGAHQAGLSLRLTGLTHYGSSDDHRAAVASAKAEPFRVRKSI